MKVLLINKFHYLKGGSETYYFALGDLLKKQGHDVIYFSMKDERNLPCEQEKYFVENVDFNAPMSKLQMLKAGLRLLYSFEAKKKLEQLILDEKPDIAHLNIFQSQLTASVVDVLHKYQIPMVYTMHDLKTICPCYTMLTHGEICERCLHGSTMNCMKHKCMKDSTAKSILATLEAYVYRIRKTYQKFDLIITPSAFYKRKLEDAGITRTPIVHMKNFLPDHVEFTDHITIGDYFLYFGRLSKEKGLFTLVEAYEKANVDRELYIVGTGPMEEDLKRRIQQSGLTGKIKMLGYKTGQDLKKLVNNSRCVVLPSEWYENGPYSILEAQAMGKPCIVSNIAGLPEQIVENETGLLFEANNEKELCGCISRMNRFSDSILADMGQKAMWSCREMSSGEKYLQTLCSHYKNIMTVEGN